MSDEKTIALAPAEAPAPEEVQAPPAPAPLPTVVHLATSIQCLFGIMDGDNDVIHRTPITIELEKLTAKSLTAVLARIAEERQKFAEGARAAGAG